MHEATEADHDEATEAVGCEAIEAVGFEAIEAAGFEAILAADHGVTAHGMTSSAADQLEIGYGSNQMRTSTWLSHRRSAHPPPAEAARPPF